YDKLRPGPPGILETLNRKIRCCILLHERGCRCRKCSVFTTLEAHPYAIPDAECRDQVSTIIAIDGPNREYKTLFIAQGPSAPTPLLAKSNSHPKRPDLLSSDG